jgi:hypothetical protein
MKTLIRTRRRDVTAERGACFHPTIGSVTPNRFTTGHPRARPRCSEREFFLPAQQQSGMEVTLLLPQDLGNGFLYTKQGGLPEYFLSHSTPSFISLYHNPASHILRPEHVHFQFFLELESLVSLLCFSSHVFLCPPCLPFFPSSTRLCVALNSQSVVRSESLTDGCSTPSPH